MQVAVHAQATSAEGRAGTSPSPANVCWGNSWSHPHTTLHLASCFPDFAALCSFSPPALSEGPSKLGQSGPHHTQPEASPLHSPGLSFPVCSCAKPEGLTDPPKGQCWGEMISDCPNLHRPSLPRTLPTPQPALPSFQLRIPRGPRGACPSGTPASPIPFPF